MSRIDENPYKKVTRSRTIATGFKPFGVGVSYTGISSKPVPYQSEGPELYDAQITESEGHPFWLDIKDLNGNKPDIGGDFYTARWRTIVDKTIFSSDYNDNNTAHRLWQHAGHYIPNTRDTYDTAQEVGVISKRIPTSKASKRGFLQRLTVIMIC